MDGAIQYTAKFNSSSYKKSLSSSLEIQSKKEELQ